MRASRRIARVAPLLLAAGGLLAGRCAANNPETQSSGPLIEALGVTKLQAQNPAELADWYATRFRLVFRPEGGGFVSQDDTALGPITFAIDRAPGGKTPETIEISFFVRNLDRVLGQLSDVGTSPRRLDTDAEGRPKAIVLDPVGNRIELVQR